MRIQHSRPTAPAVGVGTYFTLLGMHAGFLITFIAVCGGLVGVVARFGIRVISAANYSLACRAG